MIPMLYLFVVSCSDSTNQVSLLPFQLKSIWKCVGADIRAITSLQFNDRCKSENVNAEPCKWTGIACDSQNIIRNIRWDTINLPKCNLKWLPTTIKSLRIAKVALDQELHTRFLPCAVQYCRIFNCGLFGSVELRTLPLNIEELDLERNVISGSVRLTKLPECLRKISLKENM